jgi:LSD1 subclass zinc finger protein
MTPRQRETFLPVTLGQIRGHGCRTLLVYCEPLGAIIVRS